MKKNHKRSQRGEKDLIYKEKKINMKAYFLLEMLQARRQQNNNFNVREKNPQQPRIPYPLSKTEVK